MDAYEQQPEPVTAPEPAAPASPVLLGRAAILEADDLQYEDVFIPMWNGSVRVRTLTGEERDALEQSAIAGRGKNQQMNWHNFRAKLVVASVVGPDGKRLFTPRDVEAIGKKSVAALDKIAEVAQRLSAISDSDVQELTGNSNGDRDESLSFD